MTETMIQYRGFWILLDQGFYKDWFVRKYDPPDKIAKPVTPRCFVRKHYKTAERAKRAIDMHLRSREKARCLLCQNRISKANTSGICRLCRVQYVKAV